MRTGRQTGDSRIDKSLILPVYKNEENIPELLRVIHDLAEKQGPGFEAVFVVDGSPDASGALLAQALADARFPSQLISMSRNFGSFAAVRTGLQYAKGDFCAVMTADLQEPAELICQFFETLEKDTADIVLGQRASREDRLLQKWLAGFYWYLHKWMVGNDIPEGGVDVFAVNKKVKKALLSMEEHNSSLLAQLFWAGYRRAVIPYRRQRRRGGRSAWTLGKRIRYAFDSVISHSDFALRLIFAAGLSGVAVSLLLALLFWGRTEPGGGGHSMTAVLSLVVLLTGSVLLTGQGILGCYLWRAFENTKKRPLSLVDTVKQYPGKGGCPAETGRCRLLPLKTFRDLRGALSVAALDERFPFVPERIFFISGVPPGAVRGEHAHKSVKHFLVAAHGQLIVDVDDGSSKQQFRLGTPVEGLYIPEGVWLTLSRFSEDAVLCVCASQDYDPDDYINHYGEFELYCRQLAGVPGEPVE